MENSTNFIEEIINGDIRSGKCKKVITRFPPEPNGYLHIGHAKSLCINFGIKQKYNGVCNLRFDDTNPTKEEVEYVNAIKEDIRWLGFKWDKELYASDYFDIMYEKAVLLIEKGLAYVCDQTAEEIRSTRGTLTEGGEKSRFRGRTVQENLALFEGMKSGKYGDGEKVLRAKIDMASPNMNMRDPVIYRILHQPHHRTASKWCIYPMYDFAHPVEDCVENITHSICTLEFEDHRPLYDWVKINCDFESTPQQIEFARLNINKTIMSKRYLKKLVDIGFVNGWSDPRMPTLSGMRMRGYPPEAIRNFCESIGVSKANSEVNTAMLEHAVRDYLNQNAKRTMVVKKPLLLVIDNLVKDEVMTCRNNPASENDLSTKEVVLTKEIYIDQADFMVDPPPKYHRLVVDGMVRLKDSYILKYASHSCDNSGNVTAVHVNLIEDSVSGGANAGIKVKGVIQWVSTRLATKIVINEFDYILNDGAGEFSDRLNSNSKTTFVAVAEPSLAKAGYLERFQFMREGYYVSVGSNSAGVLEFNQIVSLKDGFK